MVEERENDQDSGGVNKEQNNVETINLSSDICLSRKIWNGSLGEAQDIYSVCGIIEFGEEWTFYYMNWNEIEIEVTHTWECNNCIPSMVETPKDRSHAKDRSITIQEIRLSLCFTVSRKIYSHLNTHNLKC